MNRVLSSAIVVAGLVVTLGGAISWGQVPATNDTSDDNGNTAGGLGALQHTPTGSANTAYGESALYHNTDNNNTAFGGAALHSNTTGSTNTAVGYFALLSNKGGYNNTASGGQALLSNTSGSYNAATGYGALYSNTGGYNNTASGSRALYSNTTGVFNTATGYGALYSNTGASNNTALGYQALYNSTGSRNLALGFNAGARLTSGDKNIYVGHSGAASEFNTMRLGQAPNQSRTFIAGIYNVPLSGSSHPVYINSSGQLGVGITSSARYKKDIQDMGKRSQGLYQLRPVTFHYKHDPHQRQYGLIAEEVVKIYPELVTKGADGKVESVQYHELIPMLLNEVQRQQQKLDAQAQQLTAQSQEVAGLKAQNEEQRVQNAALAARLAQLEQGMARTAAAATR
jgi:hypothetical protein